jgi:hypothetical protein
MAIGIEEFDVKFVEFVEFGVGGAVNWGKDKIRAKFITV